jgi:aerobic carbon-monoxide dehydrogenase large subunit
MAIAGQAGERPVITRTGTLSNTLENAMARDLSDSVIGRPMLRPEDASLLRGAACFVDDIALPGMLHVAFLRSPLAHARILGVDSAAARAMPGVHAVLTHADLRRVMTSDRIPLAQPTGAIRFHVDPWALAKDEACYVGEPIALIVAASRRLAEDAASLVTLDLAALPVVTDPRAGLEPGAARARLDCPDNLVARHRIDYGDVDGAFAAAAHRFAEHFRLHKGGGHSIETRGMVARFDPVEGGLTLWVNSQLPHRAKSVLVAGLGLAEHEVRVIVPTTGGGFGTKAAFHPEEMAVPAAALLLRRPLKWIEDRRENFIASVQERDQDWAVEAAIDDEGRLLAIRGRMCHDHGAATPYGVALPYNAGTNLVGPYVLPAYRLDIALCLTNFVPAAPTRGAGRPQGMYVMERLLDRIAARLGIGRDEVRRRNLIPASAMPYRTPIVTRDGANMIYDSGDYPECQRRALAAAGWSDFPERREAARREGRLIGIGVGNYVEGTGRGPFESASIRIGPSGRIVVATGATAQGQGVKTMLAQLAADVLHVDPAAIHVIDGDTAASPLGLGAFASRQAVTAGNAVYRAAQIVAEKIKMAAAALLEASPDDMELAGGVVRVKGVPGMKRSIAEIAHALSGVPGFALPGGLPPGLAAAVDYEPPSMTYTNGTHVVEAEVDPLTGAVRLNRYVVVHDCGRIINPMMVDGQVMGGVVNGIGATLYEWMQFDDDGQPLTVNYADYLLPTADTVPPIEIHHMESHSPVNPLGVKGAAESGTIAAAAVIASAVEDALAPLNLRINDLPMVPERLHALIRAAR